MGKDELIGKKINDISLRDITKIVESDPDLETISTSTKKFDYIIQCDYGTLSDSRNSPSFRIVTWGGHKRYDIRHWAPDGSPRKGIVLTENEKIIILSNDFDFNCNDRHLIKEYHSDKVSAKIFFHYITLSSRTKNDGVTWNKEINLIDWGDHGCKIDIRSWTTNYDMCSKGITLTIEEMKKLIDLLYTAEEI